MKLNTAQFAQLIENYVSHIVDGMDIDTMESVLFDVLTREYETYTEEQIIAEIDELYGEEYAQELLESVADVPAIVLAHNTPQRHPGRAIITE